MQICLGFDTKKRKPNIPDNRRENCVSPRKREQFSHALRVKTKKGALVQGEKLLPDKTIHSKMSSLGSHSASATTNLRHCLKLTITCLFLELTLVDKSSPLDNDLQTVDSKQPLSWKVGLYDTVFLKRIFRRHYP